MSETTAIEIALEGIFRELLARQVPLGLRDYLDTLRALRLGFGGSTRAELRALCQRLWARNETDLRSIDIAFGMVPLTTALDRDAREFEGTVFPADRDGSGKHPQQPAAEGASGEAVRSAGWATPPDEPGVGVWFGPLQDPTGIPLASPKLHTTDGESYVFQPQTVMSRRDLAAVWRRLRRMTRNGPALELDINKTILEKCRYGVLPRAALKPSRQNAAGLLILADVSPSMAPWRPFLQAMGDSLTLGKLNVAKMYYFSNFPRNWIFQTAALDLRIAFGEVAKLHAGSPLLVVGDGGAARGHFSPERVRQTLGFLERAAALFRPIVWLNPMPRQRWAGTSAGALIRQKCVAALPLDKEALIRTADVLRGARQS